MNANIFFIRNVRLSTHVNVNLTSSTIKQSLIRADYVSILLEKSTYVYLNIVFLDTCLSCIFTCRCRNCNDVMMDILSEQHFKFDLRETHKTRH